MDLMSTAQLLGNFGEFVGAIAVVVTLIYLAAQIRQNTRSLDESRRVALVQTHGIRAEFTRDNARLIAGSESFAAIVAKVVDAGWPSRTNSINSLAPAELQRWRAFIHMQFASLENLHYQYEQGVVDPSLYEETGREIIRIQGRNWEKLGFLSPAFCRPSFRSEVRSIANIPPGEL